MLDKCYMLASSTVRNTVSRLVVISRTVGIALNEVMIDELTLFSRLKHLASLHKQVVFISLPLSFKTLLYMLLLLLVKPRKIVLLVLPSESYVERKFLTKALKYIFNLVLHVFKSIATEVLLVYPTPIEKNLLPPMSKSLEWVFIPIMDSHAYSKDMLIPPKDYDGIAIFTNRTGDLVKISEFYKLMSQVWSGFKILVVSDQGFLGLCPPIPNMLCVETDGYEEIVSRLSLVAFMTPSITSNNILYLSAINSRIVLADHGIGLSHYMRSYGYTNVIVVEEWEPEKLFDLVVSMINQADSIKKSILALRPLEIKHDYGLGYLKYFVSRKESR